MTIQAVVFDLDGTLLDSLDDLADACNAALVSLGHPEHPRQSYMNFIGDGMETLMQRALPAHAQGGMPQALEAMRREYASRWKAKSRPYPGIPELLDSLTARGLALAVLSNKPHDFTQIIVDNYFGAWPIAAAVGVSPAIPKKPDPRGALHVAQILGVAPARCLFVGDSPMDIQAALGAGMAAVGVTWGFRTEADLLAAGATRLARRAQEILEHVSL